MGDISNGARPENQWNNDACIPYSIDRKKIKVSTKKI